MPIRSESQPANAENVRCTRSPIRTARGSSTPAKLPPDVAETLTAVAVRTYPLLGARDYARVDVRVTPAGEVFVLEMNPNPAITSLMIDEGLPVVGSTYDKFIVALVRNATARRDTAAGNRRKRA